MQGEHGRLPHEAGRPRIFLASSVFPGGVPEVSSGPVKRFALGIPLYKGEPEFPDKEAVPEHEHEQPLSSNWGCFWHLVGIILLGTAAFFLLAVMTPILMGTGCQIDTWLHHGVQYYYCAVRP